MQLGQANIKVVLAYECNWSTGFGDLQEREKLRTIRQKTETKDKKEGGRW